MLKHTGTRIIETSRLILRQFKVEDAADMYNNWASDDAVTKYLSWPTHSDIEVSKKVLKMWIDGYSSQENYNWAIEIKENGGVVGSIALMNIDNHIENCEIGYCIGRNLWNKGIMTEAFSAVIDFAFKEVGFERITGRHHVDNSGSGRVMEKCGLKYEGTLRRIHRINTGALVDCKYYSILKEEYGGKVTEVTCFKEKIIEEMKEAFKEMPFGIEHTLKVLQNAEDIMKGEDIEEEKDLIAIVAILHDIGAVEAQKKYGSIDGVYQEKEGPETARKILQKVGYSKNIDRICFIIGNHHTPSKIDGIDFQIQWEADLLENLTVMDIHSEQKEIKECIEQNFKTNTGKRIAYNRFVLE